MTPLLLSVPQAAERLGMSADAVRARLSSGAIAGGFRDRGRWRVPLEAIEAYRLQGMPELELEPISVPPRRVIPLGSPRAA